MFKIFITITSFSIIAHADNYEKRIPLKQRDVIVRDAEDLLSQIVKDIDAAVGPAITTNEQLKKTIEDSQLKLMDLDKDLKAQSKACLELNSLGEKLTCKAKNDKEYQNQSKVLKDGIEKSQKEIEGNTRSIKEKVDTILFSNGTRAHELLLQDSLLLQGQRVLLFEVTGLREKIGKAYEDFIYPGTSNSRSLLVSEIEVEALDFKELKSILVLHTEFRISRNEMKYSAESRAQNINNFGHDLIRIRLTFKRSVSNNTLASLKCILGEDVFLRIKPVTNWPGFWQGCDARPDAAELLDHSPLWEKN